MARNLAAKAKLRRVARSRPFASLVGSVARLMATCCAQGNCASHCEHAHAARRVAERLADALKN